jgi:proteasome accessory factor A
MDRIAGLETEYGCLTSDPAGPAHAVGRVRNWLFDKNRLGLADLHQRDWDEPAGNGGFLFNGGRAYVDMGHLEYCTPECRSLKDLLVYDRAGDAMLCRAVKELRLADHVSFIRNNVDHYTGATFGCHENYLVNRSVPLSESNVLALLAFLTLRVLFAGAGRVGATPGAELRGDLSRPGADQHFQMSQRADYITNDLFEWVQFNRAIINTRDEPLADGRRYRRLHLLHGDTNVLPVTLLLKVGTTALVLDLLDLDRMPRIALADAVSTFHALSHQPDGPWRVVLASEREEEAVLVLRKYYEAARAEFHGRDRETNSLLRLWDSVLTDLEEGPERLVGRVDWITKRWLFERFVEREGISWSDPWLKSLDLEYHHIDPARNLAAPLDLTPVEWQCTPAELVDATHLPPVNTRAHARSQIMHLLKHQTVRYYVDWELIDVDGIRPLNLTNPFDPRPPEMELWTQQLVRLMV